MIDLMPVSPSHPGIRLLVCGLAATLALGLGGCGTTEANDNAGSVKCGPGEVSTLDKSGNVYCVEANDAGVLADGSTSGDTGGTDAVSGGDGSDDGAGGNDGANGGDTAGAGDGTDKDSGPTDPWWACPPVKGVGKEHGKDCSSDAECMYGRCVKGGFLTGYDDSISYCTKNNGCTGDGSFTTAPCSYDDDAGKGLTFMVAFEKTKSSGNDKRTSSAPYKVCARACKTDAECADWNSKMPHCMNSTKYVSTGTSKICGFDPTR